MGGGLRKKVSRKPEKPHRNCPYGDGGAQSPSEMEVLQMQDAMREEKSALNEQAANEELFEVLIAISVVAKQLAKRVMMKGDNHEQNERTGPDAG